MNLAQSGTYICKTQNPTNKTKGTYNWHIGLLGNLVKEK